MVLFRLLLVLVVAVGLSACDSQQAADPSTDDVTSTGSPEMEGTDAETPLPPDDEVAVNLPDLPIGGVASGDPVSECAPVSLLETVPDGVSVTVTAIRFSEEGIFTARGSGCDGNPGCAGFTFTPERTTCGVALDAIGATEEEVYLILDGKCVAEDRRDCGKLGSGSSMQLYAPPSTETSTEDTETTEETIEETTDEQTPSPTE